ncbi:MAG: glycosyltransferase family 2 protein [Chloroflexi bacterium]|nr:glycosyltransferase family 2 protein [Chloroflexota bacterium]
MTRPLVSVIVPARNEEASIDACLAALLAQTYPRELLEVIVVDGRSTDGTRRRVDERAAGEPRLRVVDNPALVTPIGMNLGIRAASGDVITLMSGHGAAPDDYVERGVRDLAETGAWGVGGRIERSPVGRTGKLAAAVTSSWVGVGDADHNYATSARWVDTAFPGMWPRWVFERVGLFDEELVRNQDDELSLRIREAGGRIWYDPAIVVRYRPRGSIRGLFSQYRQYGFWKVRVLQKHPRGLRVRHFIPAAWVAFALSGPLIAAAWWPWAVVYLTGALTYAAVLAVGTRRLRGPDTSWPALIGTAAVVHAAYGIGFLHGLVALAPRWVRDRRGAPPRLPARSASETVAE